MATYIDEATGAEVEFTGLTSAAASKFGNKKTLVDGYCFDSAMEAQRYQELKLMVQAGAITDLVIHPRYELQAAFRTASGEWIQNVEYEADFSWTENGRRIVQDVKGAVTDVFALKRKLFLLRFPGVELRVTGTDGADKFAPKQRKKAA